MSNEIVNFLSRVVMMFFSSAGMYFAIRTPQGLYGRYICKKIEKGKITSGIKYYPAYAEEEEMSRVAFLFLWDLFYIGCSSAISIIFFPIGAIVALVLAYKFVIPHIKRKWAVKAEFKEKFGEKWRSYYSVYYAVSISDAIVLGWMIVGFVFVIAIFFFHLFMRIFFDERTDEEIIYDQMREDEMWEAWEKRNNNK